MDDRRGSHGHGRRRSVTPAVTFRGCVACLAVAFLGATLLAAGAAGARDGGADEASRHADVDPLAYDVEGWYTDDQAQRGREAYARHCAECHSPGGKARATFISLYRFPALTGAYFWDRWGNESVHALLLVVQETMPLHAPGTLDGDTYADITAHVLALNGFPSGPRELPPATGDIERLVAMPISPNYARPQARAQLVGPERRAALEQEEAPPEPAEPAAEGDLADEIDPDEIDPDERAWFTEAQVERARDHYFVHCSRCHGSLLEGIGVAPSLAGANFMARWDGARVSDLFWIVNELMPLDDQGVLGPGASADLVAYILAQNAFEAGETELPATEARLVSYVIEAGEVEADGGGDP